MSAIQHSSTLLPTQLGTAQPAQGPLTAEPGRIIFTRQLWQRTMPEGNETGPSVSNKSQAEHSTGTQNQTDTPSRRPSSNLSTRAQRRSPSPSRGSRTPLTPEESPPFKTTRKRSVAVVEQEDKELDSATTTPAHARSNSGDSLVHVCICQPDPKIPRPRNAFILYRQHHQAQVVAQHPGLANPEISKIIGEQWQNQPVEVKNKWKALAEEEKLRHQQQYPTYRYQPKRNGRRNSLSSETPTSAGERPKCAKCGGRSILAPSTPFQASQSTGASPAGSVPPTPGSAITPITRTLPVLRDLSLQSPAVRRGGKAFASTTMSPSYVDERDDVGPLSPDVKRRRMYGDYQQPAMARGMPPRYCPPPPGAPVGPGTPFPFGQPPSQHPYPPAVTHRRRESLPGLQAMADPPGPMAPPPRPGMGYLQHRVSQGHIPHDRSLTLPPLQTGNVSGRSNMTPITATIKNTEEQIMSIPFQYKLKVLGQIAPPALVQDTSRGPLITVEGDNADAAASLAKWLADELKQSKDGKNISVSVLDSPDLGANSGKKPMVQYHLLATEWLSRTDEIVESLRYTPRETSADSTMSDVSPVKEPPLSSRKVDEDYNVSETSSDEGTRAESAAVAAKDHGPDPRGEDMDVDKSASNSKVISASSALSTPSLKPVALIANYSLNSSNVFACRIPIGPRDQYSPSDHWQWTATQWRGVIGPDLTIFVRDAVAGENGKETVEALEDGNVFVVKRMKGEGDSHLEVDEDALIRLAFEVGQRIRRFGGKKEGSG